MITLKKTLHFIDENLLFGLSLILLAVVPLYPKWPLYDVLPGYNVRVRWEDFLILIALGAWAIHVFRGKINLKKIPLLKPILLYLAVGLLSTLSAIFITKTVTTETYQILKIFLHYLRRIEYFSLFFIFYSAFRDKKQIKAYLWVLLTAVVGVTIYGFGQKFLYWPAYSTMNREFSKGIALYLSEHARVLSTFGGHYDFAAYLMLTITLVLILAFVVKKWWLTFLMLLIAFIQFWMLNLTASRTSFLAYLVSVTVAFVFLAFKKGWLWSLPRWGLIMLMSLVMVISIGTITERFSQVLKVQQLRDMLTNAIGPPPEGGIAFDENIPLDKQLELVASDSDVPPTTVKPGEDNAILPGKPLDVYDDPYAHTNEASESGVNRVDYSDNALKHGLSTGIRLDTLWPQALAAFKMNPFFGTGYSTLVKKYVWEQTTAESTDNDYLRLLGETGLFGLITFLLILVTCIAILYKTLKKVSNPFYYGLFAAGIGMVIGLMVNALYIDVFESSKVAYTFWSFMGILLALSSKLTKKNFSLF